MHHIGKSDELLLVFSLAWAMGLAVFVQLPFMGFSLEIGGFLAGIALSRTAVHHEISARIRSLRDFFIIIFFVISRYNNG
jgi:Kef-type K+ transport system membrane component KefB